MLAHKAYVRWNYSQCSNQIRTRINKCHVSPHHQHEMKNLWSSVCVWSMSACVLAVGASPTDFDRVIIVSAHYEVLKNGKGCSHTAAGKSFYRFSINSPRMLIEWMNEWTRDRRIDIDEPRVWAREGNWTRLHGTDWIQVWITYELYLVVCMWSSQWLGINRRQSFP